jgi:4-amino-4-deoxy-L-arabinose transferase-like glycosyltransferase
MIVFAFPYGASALLVVLAFSSIALFVFRQYTEDKGFITNIFVGALVLRLIFGMINHIFDLQSFVGPDSLTYDYFGARMAEVWAGQISYNDPLLRGAMVTNGPGWGMAYLVGGIYFVLGKNMFAAQSFCAVFGAATAPMIYFCAEKIFHNRRVAKLSALAIALFPAFIIWSSQLLKDGLIIFLLVLAMTMVMQLQEKFDYVSLFLLIFSLSGIITLRFYIFYMVAIAVAGSFIVGVSNTAPSIARRTIVLILMGLALTYLGVIRNASVDFERFGSLERVQVSRLDLARADSGFDEDTDVSTAQGALMAVPMGFTYLMFAPFPWQVSNFRQSITLPEILLWWALIPLLLSGLWYTMKHRLRNAFPVLIFSLMLTLAYSIFQGNVGTAYRQRTQIQVFLFIFIAVGWTLYQEKKENRKLLRESHKRPRQ